MSQKSYDDSASLYLIPTPIGNLDDITIRSLNILKTVDLLLCEDTRETGKLLQKYNVKKKLIACHEFNQNKVLKAFQKYKIGLEHFSTVSGYGHDDLGREALDNVFADVFKTESAIVRNHFVSGTHAIACALFGNLRHGEKLISVVGTPYDTMEEVIGTRGNYRASLMGHGILYEEIPLLNNQDVDLKTLEQKIDKSVNMVTIQRSRGYSTRKSLNIESKTSSRFIAS